MNNVISLFHDVILTTNDGGLYHGTIYSNNKYMDSNSSVVFLNGRQKHVFKLKDVSSITVKKFNGKFFNVWFEDHIYRIDPTSDKYQEVASLFKNWSN